MYVSKPIDWYLIFISVVCVPVFACLSSLSRRCRSLALGEAHRMQLQTSLLGKIACAVFYQLGYLLMYDTPEESCAFMTYILQMTAAPNEA